MENLDQLDSLLDSYENSLKNEGSNYGLDKEEKKKKKFKISTSDETFRFVKTTSGKYYDEAWFHEVRVGKYNQKVYCLKNDGHECPLCKKSEQLLAKQHKGKLADLTEEQKEHNKKYYTAAMAYAAKKHFVFEGLDKGMPKDGKKIWLVKENKKKEGILDKLIPAIKSYKTTHGKDYTDINEGVDMNISSVQDVIQTTKAKYWKVTAISPSGKPSELHTDENISNKLLKDKTTWRDIYPPYEITDVVDKFEMMKLISEGNTPYWDDDKKSFIFPNRNDLQELYNKKRSENKEKQKHDDVDNTDKIANIMGGNDDDDFDFSDVKSNSANLNIVDDFDDLPF
jgi:hypothetical protein